MPSFQKNAFATPFGRNVFLRSTRDVKTVSRTLSAFTVPARTIDGNPGQKIVQPGTVLARIISGPETGKVGPFQAAGTAEIQTVTGGGTISGGTYTLTLLGATTSALQWNATAATVQTAVRAAIAASTGDTVLANSVTVTGGPVNTTPLTITYGGSTGNVAQVTAASSLTGSSPTLTPATGTAGVAGATDGRGDTANIVGICNTALFWETMHRDVEVAVVYEAAVVQELCIELQADGTAVALTNTTAAQMFAKKSLDIRFAD